jgi:hypothetical protein
MNIQGALLSKRAHIRHDMQMKIQYVLESKPDQCLKGFLSDISDGGLCLYVFQPLPEGLKIIIKSDIRYLNRIATVQWCYELDGNIYRVGVMFVQQRA